MPLEKYPIIVTHRDFYNKFKKALVGLDSSSLSKIKCEIFGKVEWIAIAR